MPAPIVHRAGTAFRPGCSPLQVVRVLRPALTHWAAPDLAYVLLLSARRQSLVSRLLVMTALGVQGPLVGSGHHWEFWADHDRVHRRRSR